MPTATFPAIDRGALLERFRRLRARSRALFDMLAPEAYYQQPISLRHPIVFYEGHLAAFAVNTLVKRALGGPGVDERLERLFARGIDPDDEQGAGGESRWPGRMEVSGYTEAADRLIERAIAEGDIERAGDPYRNRASAVFTVLEHEAMHQETLLYMWHRLPLEAKRRPDGYRPRTEGAPPAPSRVSVVAGRARLGTDMGVEPFAWDNELPPHTLHVDGFRVDRFPVTNAEYLTFVEEGGYRRLELWDADAWEWIRRESVTHPLFWERHEGNWFWRGMFDVVPLPPGWPAYVSQAEARAFARWAGARLMTEPEFHRAAFTTPAGEFRRHPWGDAPPVDQGQFDFRGFDPAPVGAHPGSGSAWGVEELVGNGWEWTRTPFRPFDGFTPLPSYPEYSADFFDDRHFVLKGASPVTDRDLLRPGFRNWFRAQYPYMYAKFRCVR